MSVGRLGFVCFQTFALTVNCNKDVLSFLWLPPGPQVHKLCQNDRQGCMFSVTLNEKVINFQRYTSGYFRPSSNLPAIFPAFLDDWCISTVSKHPLTDAFTAAVSNDSASDGEGLPEQSVCHNCATSNTWPTYANVTSWRIVQPWYLDISGISGIPRLGSNLEDLEVVAAILRPAKIQFAAPGLLEACEQLPHRPKCLNKFEKKLLGGLSAQP